MQGAIGVFDSGVGGLTVLGSIRRHLPSESTIYLGDTARVPYGSKSPEVVVRYARNNARLLLEAGCKLLVVACNTASAHALHVLQEELPIPVLGVIEPGVRMALSKARGHRIAITGTEGTIASDAYQRQLAEASPDIEVIARPCPLFVPLAEEGWTEGEVPRKVVEHYLGDLRDRVDCLVLGCTHYPLLRKTIAEVVGEDVPLVDSGDAVAFAVAERLEMAGGLRPEGEAPEHRVLVTDLPRRFSTLASRFLGQPVASVEQVDVPA